MHKIKNELCPKIMLYLFKEVTHPYNLRNGLICRSYKIKTARYGTETITPTWSKNMVNYSRDEIRESASFETFRQKIK